MNFCSIMRIILCFIELTSTVAAVDFMSDFRHEYINMDIAEILSPFPDINVAETSTATDDDEALVKTPDFVPESFSMRSLHISDAVSDAVDSVSAQTNPILAFAAADTNLRVKRTLTYPDPSTILLIFGLGTPLQLDRESVIIGAFTKMLYNLPTNSTDYVEAGTYFARTKSRWSIYKVLERAAELYGFGAGKGCLLRAICEVATAPFDLRHGLFGQMAQAFLTPSSTSEAYDEYGDREYHAAERIGRGVTENCHVLYPECERSILDIFSTTATTTTA